MNCIDAANVISFFLPRLTFAVGALGLALAVAATIGSFVRWRARDRAIETDAAYSAVAVRYKVGGAAAIDAAFEQQYPKLARRRRRESSRQHPEP